MNREQFNRELAAHLSVLPEEEIRKSIHYFNEMIDDRIEDGMTEEEAIADIGDIHEIAEGIIIEERSLIHRVKNKVVPKQSMEGWQKALLIIGAPLWIPILIAILLILFALVLVVFALFATLLVVAISCVIVGVGTIVTVPMQLMENMYAGFFNIGVGFVFIGVGLWLIAAWSALLKFMLAKKRKKLHKHR